MSARWPPAVDPAATCTRRCTVCAGVRHPRAEAVWCPARSHTPSSPRLSTSSTCRARVTGSTGSSSSSPQRPPTSGAPPPNVLSSWPRSHCPRRGPARSCENARLTPRTGVRRRNKGGGRWMYHPSSAGLSIEMLTPKDPSSRSCWWNGSTRPRSQRRSSNRSRSSASMPRTPLSSSVCGGAPHAESTVCCRAIRSRPWGRASRAKHSRDPRFASCDASCPVWLSDL